MSNQSTCTPRACRVPHPTRLARVTMTRRSMIALPAMAALAAENEPEWMKQVVERHDENTARLLKAQVTDETSRWRGIFPDAYGVYFPGSAAGIVDAFTSAYLHPKSKFNKDPELPKRIRLAAALLSREQNPEGNFYLPITNFNSPPDTAFIVRALCPPAVLARRAGEREISAVLEPLLRKASQALITGGIHTPNHRWVVSAALAQLHELYPEPAQLRRIDQWLAEGIDIDSDGQFSERSTYTYNPISDAAFVTMALKLKRPQLLEPARRNLESMLYLMHPDYEVVTEFSTRQDLNVRGDMGPYWFSLAHLAAIDKDGRFATLAKHFAPSRGALSALMEYPELTQPLPGLAPVPDRYVRAYPHNRFVRIRRGKMSATIFAGERTRFLTFRQGEAVLAGVRFASAFFGKGQFASAGVQKQGDAFVLRQELSAPYYQPIAKKVNADEWAEVRKQRAQSEVCRLTQIATINEMKQGLKVRLQSFGTNDVPLAVEFNLRGTGELKGVQSVADTADAYLLSSGSATYSAGPDTLRFGPGAASHQWTTIRGAEPKLPGRSVYVTGVTPFDLTFGIEGA